MRPTLITLATVAAIVFLCDPDEGLVLRENVRKRLLRQKRAVSKGERGESLATVVRRLKLV